MIGGFRSEGWLLLQKSPQASEHLMAWVLSPLRPLKPGGCTTMMLHNSQTSGTGLPFHQCLCNKVNESTLRHLSHASAQETKTITSNLLPVRRPWPGETGSVHDYRHLVLRPAQEECGAAFLGLRCVHVQLNGCNLIGPSLGNTDHRRKNCPGMAKGTFSLLIVMSSNRGIQRPLHTPQIVAGK